MQRKHMRRQPRAIRPGLALAALAAFLASPPGAAGPAGAPPLAVVVALDASGSLSDGDIARARSLVSGLLRDLPAGAGVSVFSFDDESRLLQPRTSSPDLVLRAVDRVERRGRFTALHDALYDASRSLAAAAGSPRAIVLVTDGRDENSALTLEDGLRVAQEAHIPVFAVGVGRVEERVLRRIAKLTGGDYVPAGSMGAPALARRVAERAAQAAGAAAGSPGATTAPLAAPRPPLRASAAPPAVPAPPPRTSAGRWVWIVPLATVAAAALLARRRRRPPPPDAGTRTLLSPTVVTRLETTEEYLEKTVVLQERPVLAVTSGPDAGGLFELSRASAVSIGRARANDIVLQDVSISSQHCRIRPEEGRFVLHDLDSTNGTFVNDKRVNRHRLADGDRVQVGETVMQFRTDRRV